MKRLAAFIGLFALLGARCQFPPDLAGGSASEGEARVVGWVVGPCDGCAADALVRVRPAGFLKDTSGSSVVSIDGRMKDLRTDYDGMFTVDSLDTGAYAIEITGHQGFSALIRVHVEKDTSLGYTTLAPSGTISGSMDPFSKKPAYRYVQVFGLDRGSRIDSATGAFFLYDIPQGIYSLRLLPASPIAQPEVLDFVSVTDSARAMVHTGEWTRAARIFLNTTAGGAGVDDDVCDFPVLLRLNGGNFDFGQAQDSGGDIRFAKGDGSPLPFEIERWDAPSKVAEIWVKVDTVFGNNAEQYVRMYWGNPAAASRSSGVQVFDTTEGFLGVQHFGPPAAGICTDATYNGYRGTLTDVVPAQGVIGDAYSFDGISSHVAFANTASGPLNFPPTGRYAISIWVNAGNSQPGIQNIAAKGYAQYSLRIAGGLWQFVESQARVPLECEISQAPATFNTWTYLCAVRDGARQFLYVNGACADSTIDFDQGIGGRIESSDLEIGRSVFPDSTPEGYFTGRLDELRLSAGTPAAGWIRLCYMNQRADDLLVSVEK